MEFDDLETIEHTKKKPVSVTQAVESKTRRILGVVVARMPAKGLLAEKSAKRYGPRIDERKHKRRELFEGIRHFVADQAVIKSDSHPHYHGDVAEFFPSCSHVRFLGRKPRDSGFGELKEGIFDPLFSINHTFAMNRYGVSALIRKSWCNSKKVENLEHHLNIYADYHNEQLEIAAARKTA